MTVPWAGRLALGPGWAVFVGRAGDSRPHRHPAIQLCIGHGAPVRVELEDGPIEAPGLLIGADARHALQAGPVLLLHVERQSALGRRLDDGGSPRLRRLERAGCDALMARWQAADSPQQGVDALVDALAGSRSPGPPQQGSRGRLRALVAALPALPPESWHSEELARRVHLSPDRFGHAFRELAGMAPRPYLRWLRLARALQEAARGRSLTDAAHAAGFADASHLSRTMQRHFGVTPRTVVRALRDDGCTPSGRRPRRP